MWLLFALLLPVHFAVVLIRHMSAKVYKEYIYFFELCTKYISSSVLKTSEFSRVHKTGPRSAVGNVSGYRCVSDCRSRGREFDPSPVPYFRGD